MWIHPEAMPSEIRGGNGTLSKSGHLSEKENLLRELQVMGVIDIRCPITRERCVRLYVSEPPYSGDGSIKDSDIMAEMNRRFRGCFSIYACAVHHGRNGLSGGPEITVFAIQFG